MATDPALSSQAANPSDSPSGCALGASRSKGQSGSFFKSPLSLYKMKVPGGLVLASASPRRRELLGYLGIDFQSISPGFNEPPPEKGVCPEIYALYLADEKCEDVARENPASVVIAADTIVVLGNNKILGKPKSQADALKMLSSLQGNIHKVITAVAIKAKERQVSRSFAVTSKVLMASCSQDLLRSYIASGEPIDKAGAYAIQGQGVFLVKSIEGSYSNIVGLPLAELCAHLTELGIIGV